MFKRVILLVAVAGVVGCGGKKKESSKGGATGSMAPARPSPEVAHLRKGMTLGATEKERYAAIDKLVKGWPRTKGALPAALGLLRADKENRGGFAMSLARLGQPLVPALCRMVAKSPRHLPTARAAGALAYHLVLRSGLTKRTDAELARLRTELRPVFKAVHALFLTDTRPEYEIYQGVAVGGAEAIGRFKLPIPQGGLTRVAMVLYLILTNKSDEALLPAPDRVRLRKQVVALAKPFAEALPRARPDGTGESPDSLMIGLSVLGVHAARALATVPALGKQAGCLIIVKALHNLLDQFPVQTAEPLRPLLKKCTGYNWTEAPNVPPALRQALRKLDRKAPSPARAPMSMQRPRPASDHKPMHNHPH